MRIRQRRLAAFPYDGDWMTSKIREIVHLASVRNRQPNLQSPQGGTDAVNNKPSASHRLAFIG